MFEAVNSVISNAPFIKGVADQLSTGSTSASALNAPEAPYISPHIVVDTDFDKAVIQIRDSDTGDVLNQFPSRETLAARARRAEAETRVEINPVRQREEIPQKQVISNSSSSNYAEVQQIASADVTLEASALPTPSATPQAVSAALSSAAQSGQSQTTVSTQA